jgi:mono/diheme cytochrome c family protein
MKRAVKRWRYEVVQMRDMALNRNVIGRLSATLGAIAAALVVIAPASAANAVNGQELFRTRCGMCHQTNGMGVGLLARRADVSKGLLEARDDLQPAVIKTLVRQGIGNMPRIARGEVTDSELEAIAAYLSRSNHE